MSDKDKIKESKKKWNKEKSEVVQLRLKIDDAKLINEAAERKGLKRTEYIRKLIFDDINKNMRV